MQQTINAIIKNAIETDLCPESDLLKLKILLSDQDVLEIFKEVFVDHVLSGNKSCIYRKVKSHKIYIFFKHFHCIFGNLFYTNTNKMTSYINQDWIYILRDFCKDYYSLCFKKSPTFIKNFKPDKRYQVLKEFEYSIKIGCENENYDFDELEKQLKNSPCLLLFHLKK